MYRFYATACEGKTDYREQLPAQRNARSFSPLRVLFYFNYWKLCTLYMIQEASISTRFSNNAEITLQIVMVLLQENSPAASFATTYDTIGIWDVIGLWIVECQAEQKIERVIES